MADRFRDFDAEAAERHAEPISFRMFDKTWELPGEPPAALVLRVARMVASLRARHGDDVDLTRLEDDLPPEDLILLATDAISGPVLRALQDEGLTTSQLADLLSWLLGEWQVFAKGASTVGEAPAPPGAPSTTHSRPSGGSSTAGATSRPTSPASTPSTSETPAASAAPIGPSPAPRPWAG